MVTLNPLLLRWKKHINIVTGFLTTKDVNQPRKLFCHADESWSTRESTVFEVSSERSLFESPLSNCKERLGIAFRRIL